jgi:hypothetical protein
MTNHELFGGKLQLYKRGRGRKWQCSASFKGRQYRSSTKTDSFIQAQEIAEDWYLTLLGKARAGVLKTEKTFALAAEQFLKNTPSSPRGSAAPAGLKGMASGYACISSPFSVNSAYPK